MTKNNFKEWFRCASVRALKTIAQSMIALIPAGIMISEVDWLVVLSTSVLAGILSLLTSVAGIPEVEK